MKLRRNSLQALRFDPSGAFDPQRGIDPTQVAELLPRLDAIRNEMMQGESDIPRTPLSSDSIHRHPIPLDTDFVSMPQRLLAEYAADRLHSELARLFRRATYLHSIVDRVVVLGRSGALTGARAILGSCCQPYWNELSRADRGSKPRIYFEGNNGDNDATQAMLYLLGAHREMVAETELERWALVVIDDGQDALETTLPFPQFLSALEKSTPRDRDKLIELVVPVMRSDGHMRQSVSALGVTDLYRAPGGVGDGYSVLSAVGLVPAAMMGVNVIELLEGAVAMTNHFAVAPPEDNIVLQFVAVNHRLAMKHKVTQRALCPWSQALEGFGCWYQHLATHRADNPDSGMPQVAIANTCDLHSRPRPDVHGIQGEIINNIIVDEYRFDSLPANRAHGTSNHPTMPEAMKSAIARSNQALHESRRPTTDLFVPRVDELHVGQLFQFMMLAAVVEGRLYSWPDALE